MNAWQPAQLIARARELSHGAFSRFYTSQFFLVVILDSLESELAHGLKESEQSNSGRFDGAGGFLFQPAEEGVPKGETGGAPRMIAEGALDAPKFSAVFGIHVFAGSEIRNVS